MKRISIFVGLIIALTVISTQAFSQMRIGIKAGVNYANFNYEGAGLAIDEGRLGPLAGVVAYFGADNSVYAQTGVLYSVKGSKISEKDDDLGVDLDVDMKYEFIEVPLNVGFAIPIGSNFKISPYIGGYGAYAFKGTAKLMGMSFDIFDNEFIDDEDKAKRIDYGANAGLSFHFGRSLLLNAQYSHGLANLGDAEDKLSTRAASLGLTFLF